MKNNLKRKTVLSILTGISLFGITNCSNFNNSYGYLSMGVKFPEKGFSIKDIPANTSTISVEVSGDGLLNPITFTLNKFEPHKSLSNIAQGNKNITASAKSEDGTVVASGRNAVNIIAGQNNTVEVILVAVNNNPAPSNPSSNQNPAVIPTEISPSPSPSVSPEVTPTPEPTSTPTPSATPTPSSTPTASAFVPSGGGGGGFPIGDNTPTPSSSSLNVNVTATDGTTSKGISIETPKPSGTPTSTSVVGT